MDTRATLGGISIPMVGFGTYMIEDEPCITVVAEALNAGYRHIDTAEFYGNHVGVGKAIKASGVPREEIFVTTKVSMFVFAFNN